MKRDQADQWTLEVERWLEESAWLVRSLTQASHEADLATFLRLLPELESSSAAVGAVGVAEECRRLANLAQFLDKVPPRTVLDVLHDTWYVESARIELDMRTSRFRRTGSDR
jgi:hypothetical protein